MASPHQAGAAVLIRQRVRPGRVPEIKSALAMTAKQEVFLEDQVTPANAFARAAAACRWTVAVHAGLVLHETKANYLAANPAAGGDPSALNQPSMASRNCIRAVRLHPHVPQHAGVPSVVERQRAGPGGQRFAGAVHHAAGRAPHGDHHHQQLGAAEGWHVELRHDGAAAAGARQSEPAGAAPARGRGGTAADARAAAGVGLRERAAGSNEKVSFTVKNTGGVRLDFTVDNTGTGTSTISEAAPATVHRLPQQQLHGSGDGGPGEYASDDFTVPVPTRLTELFVEGFIASNAHWPPPPPA